MRPKLQVVAFAFFLCGLQVNHAQSPFIVLDPRCQLPAAEPPLAPGNPAPSTRRMAERLQRIREQADPSSTPFLSGAIAGVIEKSLTNTTEFKDKVRLQFQLG